ncbi:MAG: 50S ribosomal protein L23 [Candidatus Cloacimonetes bacterium]|nr:50S ribosomal protein L23 [Candidatus Cloacimonadota bacterium]MCF7814358.1 50S ribosomal protein L23 [Candidatus Cloacimonadota bacterium]MCF7868950.1 50S ribosomal protein L23 [Candidatus Cloacimonadota bacterium]MCF7884344.1 50S ribosomal protein L23 [Candidatus Cloacimonadota bacterium]
MKQPREIVISPIITEKSSSIQNANNSYTFKVSINANKIEIRYAIERIFNVHVLDVNTIRQRGKVKRMGRYSGKRADWKKAIVKLREGDSIAEFEA